MIKIRDLHVYYDTDGGRVHAVRGINLQVEAGQFYTLLGPSGCGKTTTLRSVAGLETPQRGEIFIGNDLVFSSTRNVFLPAYKRDIGMVFQSYAIWPHLNVFENVAFPLREMKRRLRQGDIKKKVAEVLALVKLDGLAERPAPFLSGGQQQRLALARALVKEPSVLLLDEPLSNLDAKLREETRFELRELVNRLKITTLYVTHDQLEALTMSDVVTVMDQGRVVQSGAPIEIYQAPQERFVANFIGLTNFIEGRVETKPNGNSTLGEVETGSGRLRCVLPQGISVGDSVCLVARPEDIHLLSEPGADDSNIVRGKVEAVVFMGDAVDCQVSVATQRLRVKVHPSTAVRQGDDVILRIPPNCCRALRGV